LKTDFAKRHASLIEAANAATVRILEVALGESFGLDPLKVREIVLANLENVAARQSAGEWSISKMWTYKQSSGVLDYDGAIVGVGYSGAPDGKNDPLMQDVPRVGPIPRGLYTISVPFDSPSHGPCAMHLIPDAGNEMFGRSGFLMHGDSIERPGCASEGCIIMQRAVRDRVAGSADKRLLVVA